MANPSSSALQPWQETVNQKRYEREEKLAPYVEYTVDELLARPTVVDRIAEKSSIEPESAREITDIDAIEELLSKLSTGALTAEDVVLAYIKRWAISSRQQWPS